MCVFADLISFRLHFLFQLISLPFPRVSNSSLFQEVTDSVFIEMCVGLEPIAHASVTSPHAEPLILTTIPVLFQCILKHCAIVFFLTKQTETYDFCSSLGQHLDSFFKYDIVVKDTTWHTDQATGTCLDYSSKNVS